MALKSKKRPRSSSSSSSSSAAAADWASLPEEILDLILNHLIQLSDYLRFSAVCKPWLSAAAHQKHHRRREVQNQTVPLLLITPPPPTEKFQVEAEDDRRKLYSVTGKKVLNLELRVPHRGKFCGSSFGWLAAADGERGFSVTLFNPFSGKSIRLPPIRRTSEYPEVNKVVLSCDPSLMPNDFVVFAIYGSNQNRVAYIKPSHERWTRITDIIREITGRSQYYWDVVCHQKKFYLLTDVSGLISVDVSETMPRVEIVMALPNSMDEVHIANSYIVISSSGADLLLVHRFRRKELRPVRWMTSHFKVYRLVSLASDAQIAERVEISSLGNDALFLGDSFSLSVSASNFPGCQSNCIYYADHYVYYSGPEDRGIYSLEHGSLAPHYRLKTKKQRLMCTLSPQWIVPSLL